MSRVKSVCLELNLQVEQPESLKHPSAIARLRSYRPDLLIVVAYGLILPKEVLDIPTSGAINIHASLLPRWRGAAPIHRAILAGDDRSGITIMQMAEGLDTGDILLQESMAITRHETGGTLHDKLATLGSTMLLTAIRQIEKGEEMPCAQDESRVTYANKITKLEAQLDWSQGAVELERKIRAFNPSPVAWTPWQGGRLRIWQARLGAEQDLAQCGQVLEIGHDGLLVQTGRGILVVTEVQLEGGKPMGIEALARTRRMVQGALLG